MFSNYYYQNEYFAEINVLEKKEEKRREEKKTEIYLFISSLLQLCIH